MALLDKFEKYDLLFGPSPISKFENLAKELGGKVNIYAKREDRNSGLAFAGNKLRKFEYIVPEIIAGDYTHIVSIGGIQSNQTLMTIATACKLGLKAVTVQENWVPIPEAEKATYDKVGNIEAARILGGDVRLVPDGFDIGMRKSFEEALQELTSQGFKPYPVPAGCSEHKYGGLGFVGFADELIKQEKEMGIKFDKIVVCCVTGSTAAGIFVGMAQYGRENDVIAIDASGKPEKTFEQTLRIINHTSEILGLGKKFDTFNFDTRFGGPVYGIPNEGTIEAIKLLGKTEGTLTDPVYEGKSMQGLIELVKEDKFEKDSNVLFVHLGGASSLSAYQSYFS
ncbi:hypothetical protein PICMEDRAFT_16701 [Pichia membranifaciens NRRL Y-2026]|uniref:Tryptophan synthase beta chain-like PALP domain-containing protein n=1 Tax=Pichia membranifaciens NRRL Y-2026 TaxID=763406 RepID=A0A1E3NN75_9ASCO|nr:hypothetical protein PICMEDRAFT_16701 [Pichia membranifaciens NRRL Y-2026]ODQ46893.1 hypothetical protein PICMEDRAFT_16701 [Pichia membranifaciens NRRL Y-2026]